MGHYEHRLEADKTEIRGRVARVAEQVSRAVLGAVDGLLRGDRDGCYRIILGDLPINREIRAIDARCHAFVARHLPSAGHLRFVSSTLRMTVAIERVGDYAVTIAREAVQLSAPPPAPLADLIRELADRSVEMLRRATRAYADRDADLARETKPLSAAVHRGYYRVFRRLVEEGSSQPPTELLAIMAVFERIERVSDQAKNMCEEALFELTGETKPPKVYRVLFVDDDNTLLGPLATAIGRKSFPQSGKFDTAGLSPAPEVSPALAHVADRLGLDVSGVRPKAIGADPESLADYHVIVGLTPEVRDKLHPIPFHTVFLHWDLAPTGPAADADLDAAARRIAAELRDLMTTMRGEDAA